VKLAASGARTVAVSFGTPYLLREPARLVLLTLLQLQDHPGARATTSLRADASKPSLDGAYIGQSPARDGRSLADLHRVALFDLH
jgi:hypothetical protein